MKRLLSLCVALVATIWMWAGNVITYTASAKLSETTSSSSSGLHTNAFGTGVSISNHTFSDGTGTIIFNKNVEKIGSKAFYGCKDLTSIEIPNSVTNIGASAFSGCTGLTSTTIPESVTSIGNYAFSYCSGLTSIEISNSVTSIEKGVFQNCTGLTSIEIPNNVTSIGESAFSRCTGLISITIPESVTSIGNYAFLGCTGLTLVNIFDIAAWCNISYGNSESNPLVKAKHLYLNGVELKDLVIPNSVTSIGASAFSGCIGLTSVTIPESVASIGGGAFSGCTGLISITIPESVTSIGNYAFSGILTVFYSGTATGSPWGAKIANGYVDGYLVYSDDTKTTIHACSQLATGAITIPNSVTSIKRDAFSNCTGLTEVHISDIETWCSISFGSSSANPLCYAHHLFLNGQEISDLTFPSSLTQISGYAFSGCYSLKTATLPNTITTIEYDVFRNCKNLTSIEIPNTVTIIGSMAFEGCSGLTSVTIPNSVTKIRSAAFQGCTGLTTIEIPNSVTTIESYAFARVRNVSYYGSAEGSPWGAKTRNGYVDGYLVFTDNSKTILSGCSTAATGNIIIPNGVTNINQSAFQECRGLTSVTIPNSMTTIGVYAFEFCSNLTSVHIDDIENWCRISFGSDDANPLYYAHHLFLNDREVTDLVIPNGVTSIVNRAFYGCSSITSLTIPNSVTNIGFYAFRDCSALTSIEIPNSVTSIGTDAFSGCTNLTSIVWNPSQCSLPNNGCWCDVYVTSFTFGNDVLVIPGKLCSGLMLTSVSIPNSVTSIGERAFSNCSSLTSVFIGNGVTNIGNEAFYNCNELTSISMGSNTSNIGESAFEECSSLTTIKLPNSVTSIGGRAFSYCTGLTSVEIPNSVTTIGYSAFLYCTGLTSITCKATNPPTIDESTFRNLYNVPVYIPCESIDAYQSAQYWSNFNSFQGYDCSYNRSTIEGNYGTICLPKAVNAADITGGTFFNIVNAVTNNNDEVIGILIEEENGNLIAGKSYIFIATANEISLQYSGASVNNPVETYGLVGNLDENSIEVPQGMYVLSNNRISIINGSTTNIGQNESYIDLTSVTKLPDAPTEPGQVVLYVENYNPIVTDIENTDVEEKTVKFLKDGRLFIIHNGKTHDLLGNIL